MQIKTFLDELVLSLLAGSKDKDKNIQELVGALEISIDAMTKRLRKTYLFLLIAR